MAGSITNEILAPQRDKTQGLKKIAVTITTDASGDATATVVGTVYGRLVGLAYKQGTLDSSCDLTISVNGATVFANTDGFGAAATKYIRPTTVVTTNAGVAVTAAATAPNVNRDITLAGRVKVGCANGGNAGTGYLWLLVDEARGAGGDIGL